MAVAQRRQGRGVLDVGAGRLTMVFDVEVRVMDEIQRYYDVRTLPAHVDRLVSRADRRKLARQHGYRSHRRRGLRVVKALVF